MAKWISIARAACVDPLAGSDRACRFLCCLPGFDFLGHVFSPFLPLFLRGTQGRVGPAPAAALAGEPKKPG